MNILQKKYRHFILAVALVTFFVLILSREMETVLLNAEQRQNLELKDIDCTDLFYTDSRLSREIYFDRIIGD